MRRRSSLLAVALAGVLSTGGAAVATAQTVLPSNCAQSGRTVTCSYGYTGTEQTFTVPTGVTSVEISAIGAAGGAPPGASGGAGALVAAAVSVRSGAALYVEVGQAGAWRSNSDAPPFNGGGISGNRGQGGGASDVRTAGRSSNPAAATLASRLIVAGGGGGSADCAGDVTRGGDAGADGAPETAGPYAGQGGRAGTAEAGGAGGAGATLIRDSSVDGKPGQLGSGGTGSSDGVSASGGGGGLYGGGGGGGGVVDPNRDAAPNRCRQGGGGGGSSLVPAGGTGPTVTTAAASVTISYVVPVAAGEIAATSGSGQSAQVGQAFVQPLVATVTGTDGAPFAGAPVTFTVSGPASFGGQPTATVTTGADGRATSPTVTAGSSPGSVTVSASTPGVSGVATFTLTVTAAPASVKGAGTLTASDGTRYSLSVDAQATVAGAASGTFAFSGGGADTTASSRTITSVRRTSTGGTVSGTATTSRGQTVSFTLTVVDRAGGRDQVTVQLGDRTVTGTLTNGDIVTR